MSPITSPFVIAVHDEILRETGVGHTGCHTEKLESVLNRIDQQIYYNNKIIQINNSKYEVFIKILLNNS